MHRVEWAFKMTAPKALLQRVLWMPMARPMARRGTISALPARQTGLWGIAGTRLTSGKGCVGIRLKNSSTKPIVNLENPLRDGVVVQFKPDPGR
jgi:hypothetical protein